MEPVDSRFGKKKPSSSSLNVSYTPSPPSSSSPLSFPIIGPVLGQISLRMLEFVSFQRHQTRRFVSCHVTVPSCKQRWTTVDTSITSIVLTTALMTITLDDNDIVTTTKGENGFRGVTGKWISENSKLQVNK